MKSKAYINFIISGLCLLSYILFNLISVQFAPQEILTVLLKSGLAFLCLMFIRFSMTEQGLISGERMQEVFETKRTHINAVDKVKSQVQVFNNWCAGKNKDALKEARVAKLSDYSLDYDLYFDDGGNFKDVEVPKPTETDNPKLNKAKLRDYKKKVKCLNQSRFLKVPPYVASEILFRDSVISKGKRFGQSKKDWKQATIISGVLFSIVTFVALSYIGVGGKAISLNAAVLILFQFLIMIASALMFYFSAFNFITGEWRDGIIQKILAIEEFLQVKQSGIVIAEMEPVPQVKEVEQVKEFKEEKKESVENGEEKTDI